MGKVNNKSIPAVLLRYLIVCFVICAAGVFVICLLSDRLEMSLKAASMKAWSGSHTSGQAYEYAADVRNVSDSRIYPAVHYGRYLVIPLWSVLCLWVTINRFYKKEMKRPIDTLTQAAEKILSDDLDFTVKCDSDNELGQLCDSFEQMKCDLYESNYVLWKSLEERKRLNSAFSHDLRTPITVLKGYTELISRFGNGISPEKQSEIISKMSGQVSRLERYTEKMTGLHKLEDIIPEPERCSFEKLCGQLSETGSLLCGNFSFTFNAGSENDVMLCTDTGIVMQVFENIIGNALRYAESSIGCSAAVNDDILSITVTDDGKGFSDEALRRAWQPFYRDETSDEKEHFGLGLYICRLLCKKCGGDISVSNSVSGGGSVTAAFSVKDQKVDK